MEETENKKSFIELTVPYVEPLYYYAFLLTNDYAKANKLVIKTYEQAHRFFDYHSPGANIKFYLFRIMNNSLPVSEGIKEENISEIDLSKVDLDNVEKELTEIDSNTISHNISNLSADIKKVIALYQIGEFKPEEIAEIVDVPEGVVLTRLYTGRKLLLEKLAKEKKLPLKSGKELNYAEKKKITALVQSEEEKVEDESLIEEVQLQQLIKRVLNSNLIKEKPPDELKGNILGKFSATFEEKIRGSIKASRSKRYVVYATIVMTIVVITAILFYEPDIKKPKNFAAEQNGRTNLLIQLQNTFEEFKNGRFTIVNGDAETLKDYMHQNGLTNEYKIFQNKTLKLTGWFVNKTEEGKPVFLVYEDEQGKTVLMHQSPVEKLQKGKSITLTKDLIDFLLTGRCYSTTKDNFLCLLKSDGSNIFVFATELPAKNLILEICKQK